MSQTSILNLHCYSILCFCMV